MDIHTIEPVTPSLSYENVNYWNSEDSGYHTSYTPGSLESSEISADNFNHAIFNRKISFSGQFQVDCYNLTKDISFSPVLKYNNGFSTSNEGYNDSPQNRRGIKRSYQEETENTDLGHCSILTPTSIISGDLRKLRFSDSHKISFSAVNFCHKDLPEIEISVNENVHPPYPTTPVKKVCRNSCTLKSPLRRPPQRLNFVIHSLSCETQALQPVTAVAKPNSNVKRFQFKPNQKIDIIKLLYSEANVMPPIMKIFSYLSNKDIFNVTLVSPLWQKVWEDVSRVKTKKQDYLHFLRNVRENQENKMAIPKNIASDQIRPLMEIHNILYNNHQTSSPVSPPGSPRTMRFKKYTKAAQLDPRKQLPCVRCHQPAKVTEESSGEEWLECTNPTCSNQFCRFCKLERHPGKKCFQYDLDGPSPSKRKKNTCSIGTKKSRRNLRRLL